MPLLSSLTHRLPRPDSWWAGCILIAIFTITACQSKPVAPRKTWTMDPAPTAIDSHHLHNLYRLGPRLYSGSAPESTEAFDELARLGIKTVISVDGTQPDVSTARQKGIRYIHLPIGYDGVPSHRVAELYHAFNSAPGPVFVHCHHGKHRGPAAVAVVCEAAAGWSPDRAIQWMHQAGTGAEYPGLYRSAAEFRPLDPESLRRRPALPERTATSPMVDAMVALDSTHDALRTAQKAGWPSLSNGNERNARELSVVFWEQWKELRRAPGTQTRPEDFQKWLTESENAADQLRNALAVSPPESNRANQAMTLLAKNCTACHKVHRN